MKRRSDVGVKRPTKLEREEVLRKHREAFEQETRRMLRDLSNERLLDLVASIEAGDHDGVEVAEPNPPSGLAEVFELAFVVEEVARRGWPDLRVSLA